MGDLVQELERATEGSRDLDQEIRKLLVAQKLSAGQGGAEVRQDMGHWSLGYPDSNIPHYTTSLDAALTLVPPNVTWRVKGGPQKRQISAWVAGWDGYASTPALALCIAVLRAREDTLTNAQS